MNHRMHRTFLSLAVVGLVLTAMWCSTAQATKGDGGHSGGSPPPTAGPTGGGSSANASASSASSSSAVSSAIGGAGGLGGSVNGSYGYSTRFLGFPASGSPPPVPAGMCIKASMADYGVGWNFWRHATAESETDFDCLRLVAALAIEPRLPPLAPGEPLHPPSITVAPVFNLAPPCCAASAPLEPPPPVVKPVKPKPHPKHHVKSHPRHPPKPTPPVIIQPAGPMCPNGQTLMCRSEPEHRHWWKW